MFTGVIQALGRVESNHQGRLRLKAKLGRIKLGASVAVGGVCLTIARRKGRSVEFDLSPETLRLTNLGRLRPGDPVNLEASLRLGDGLSGHLVSGHVDAVAEILQTRRLGGGCARYRVALPKPLRRFVAYKGSIAVNGASLTVTGLGRGWFETVLIPHTLKASDLGALGPGDLVNLEVDQVARYLRRLLQKR